MSSPSVRSTRSRSTDLVVTRDPSAAPAADSPEYPEYLQWLHFAESSGILPLLLDMFVRKDGSPMRFLPDYASLGIAELPHGGSATDLREQADALLTTNTSSIPLVELRDIHKAFGGVKAVDGRWSANVWARNLFDKRYAAAFGNASANTPYIAILGEPRTFGFTLTGRY